MGYFTKEKRNKVAKLVEKHTSLKKKLLTNIGKIILRAQFLLSESFLYGMIALVLGLALMSMIIQ